MISSEFLESNIEQNFSSYESRKKAISNLKEFIKKESHLIDDLVIKAPIKETISKRCELNDGWTAVTKDKSLSAQFEHTVGITENGYEIFTESAKGYSKPPYK